MSVGETKKLLLAEDDEGTIYSVERVLELCESSLVMVVAKDGQQTIDLCKNGMFNLVLMDIRMPKVDGIEATKKIRQLKGWEKVPIIAFTANEKDYPRSFCLGVGMNDLLSKPFDIDELAELIDSYLFRSDQPS